MEESRKSLSPEEIREAAGGRTRFGTRRINADECLCCGACERACPAGAISERQDHFAINGDACIGCGACEDACPAGAVHG